MDSEAKLAQRPESGHTSDVPGVMFGAEPIAQVIEDAATGLLISRHVREVSQSLPFKIQIDSEFYQRLEDNGALRTFSVRMQDPYQSCLIPCLIGYETFLVTNSPQSPKEIHAHQDTLYLHPEARRHNIGIEFIRWCDDQLRSEGIAAVHQLVPANTERNIGPIFKRMGYELTQHIWTRRFDDG